MKFSIVKCLAVGICSKLKYSTLFLWKYQSATVTCTLMAMHNAGLKEHLKSYPTNSVAKKQISTMECWRKCVQVLQASLKVEDISHEKDKQYETATQQWEWTWSVPHENFSAAMASTCFPTHICSVIFLIPKNNLNFKFHFWKWLNDLQLI